MTVLIKGTIRRFAATFAVAVILCPLYAIGATDTHRPDSSGATSSRAAFRSAPLLAQANDQEAWRALEAEQARRRRAREQSPAPEPKPRAAAPEMRRSPTSTRIERGTGRPAAQSTGAAIVQPQPSRPRPSSFLRADPLRREVPPNRSSRTSSCYAAVGIQTDATGRPLRDIAAVIDERSQDAFIRCVDGR